MLSDSLWQLISQMKVSLFHTYFPSLKLAVDGKAYNAFEQLSESRHFPLNSRAHSGCTVQNRDSKPPPLQTILSTPNYNTFSSQLQAHWRTLCTGTKITTIIQETHLLLLPYLWCKRAGGLQTDSCTSRSPGFTLSLPQVLSLKSCLLVLYEQCWQCTVSCDIVFDIWHFMTLSNFENKQSWEITKILGVWILVCSLFFWLPGKEIRRGHGKLTLIPLFICFE